MLTGDFYIILLLLKRFVDVQRSAVKFQLKFRLYESKPFTLFISITSDTMNSTHTNTLASNSTTHSHSAADVPGMVSSALNRLSFTAAHKWLCEFNTYPHHTEEEIKRKGNHPPCPRLPR